MHDNELILSRKLTEAHKHVEVGSLYAHYRSLDKLYKVLAIGLLEATEEPNVVYQALHNSVVWVRALDSWLLEVIHEGQVVPRFQKVV